MPEVTKKVYPSKEFPDKVVWYLGDEIHRDDGPAIIYVTGEEFWYQHSKRHRVGGPAAKWPNGREEWYLDDNLHRIGGPAVYVPNGKVEWWVNGKQIFMNEKTVLIQELYAKATAATETLSYMNFGTLLFYLVGAILNSDKVQVDVLNDEENYFYTFITENFDRGSAVFDAIELV